MNKTQVAEAFSKHRFDEATEHFADTVEWTMIGHTPIIGKEAVVGVCAASAEEFGKVETTFISVDTVVGDDAVVVDTLAEYTEPNGDTSTVASCDIYRFEGEKVTSIRSYNIELPSK